MDLKMKQRLVGLLVVLALLAIFLPMISYKMEPKRGIHLSTNIPSPPELPKVQLAGVSSAWSSTAENEFVPLAQKPNWVQATQATGEVFIGKSPPAVAENTVLRPKAPPALVQNIEPHLSKPTTKSSAIRVAEVKASKSTGSWIIQLGTFSNSQNIHVLLSKLSERGIPTFKQTAFSKNGEKMVRIFVGPMLTENQAANVKKELQRELHISGIIKRKTA